MKTVFLAHPFALPKIYEPVAVELAQALVSLRHKGVRVSQSALIEVAIQELLNRRDLPELLRRYGARAKREPER